MSKENKRNIKIDKSQEPRKPGISQMIDEGGLGADKYYEIKKKYAKEQKEQQEKNEW